MQSPITLDAGARLAGGHSKDHLGNQGPSGFPGTALSQAKPRVLWVIHAAVVPGCEVPQSWQGHVRS